MSDPSSLRAEGLQALREKNFDRAIELLAQVVMANEQDAEARAALGWAYSEKGLHEPAVRALRSAASTQPSSPNILYYLAAALERAGDRAGAVEAYGRVLAVNPQHPGARSRMAALSGGPAAAPPPQPPRQAPLSPAPGAGMLSPSAPPHVTAQPQGTSPQAPPGTVLCPNCNLFSSVGMLCEYCSAPLPPPPRAVEAPRPAAADPSEVRIETRAFTSTDMDHGEAFFRRAVALFLDGCPIYFLVELSHRTFQLGRIQEQLDRVQASASFIEVCARLLALGVLDVGIPFLYGAICYSLLGRTLGKVCLGLKVIRPDGSRVGFLRGGLRESVGKWMSGLCCSLGYWMMFRDPDQQTWHDQLCDTYVIRRSTD